MSKETAASNTDAINKVLQANLVDHVVLALQIKQAHWNIVGPRFLSLHKFYDKIYEDALTFIDESAERIRQLNGFPNGNVDQLKDPILPPMPTGAIRDEETVTLVLDRLHAMVKEMRKRLDMLEESDVVTADMVHNQIHTLEVHAWMLQATAD